MPLRPANIAEPAREAGDSPPKLPEGEVVAHLLSGPGDPEAYARFLTLSVHDLMVPYFGAGLAMGTDAWVPPWENFLLHGFGYLYPDYRFWEFSDHHKAVRRGIGLCSQHAVIVCGFLNEKGIRSRILPLDGHVVATAQIDRSGGRWWILDAFYGVVMPLDLETMEQDPESLVPYYKDAGVDTETIRQLVAAFGRNGNYVLNGPRDFYRNGEYYVEIVSYFLKWLLPALLIAPAVFTWFRRYYPAR